MPQANFTADNSLKVKVIGSNPDYLSKSSLLHQTFIRQECHVNIPFMKIGKTTPKLTSSLKIKTTFSERSLWEVIQWHPCMKQPAAWLISKFMMDAFFAKQQSLTLINVILGPSIVGKNMEFPLQVNLCQKFLFLFH